MYIQYTVTLQGFPYNTDITLFPGSGNTAGKKLYPNVHVNY